LIEIETLKRVRLRDNDIIVLKHPGRLPIAACRHIQKSMRETLSSLPQKNIKVIILEEGMDIDVLGKDETGKS